MYNFIKCFNDFNRTILLDERIRSIVEHFLSDIDILNVYDLIRNNFLNIDGLELSTFCINDLSISYFKCDDNICLGIMKKYSDIRIEQNGFNYIEIELNDSFRNVIFEAHLIDEEVNIKEKKHKRKVR